MKALVYCILSVYALSKLYAAWIRLFIQYKIGSKESFVLIFFSNTEVIKS